MCRQLASLSTKSITPRRLISERLIPGTRSVGRVGRRSTTCFGGLVFIMLQGLATGRRIRGRTIYYRGYVIQEAGGTIYCSISGPWPERQELALSETSQDAMRWIDQQVAPSNATEPLDWPTQSQQAPWQFFGTAYTPVFG